MNGFWIDTNVVSEFSRTGGPDQRVKWLKSIPAASLYVSVLTLAEILRGIELREPDGLFFRASDGAGNSACRHRWITCGDSPGTRFDSGHARQ